MSQPSRTTGTIYLPVVALWVLVGPSYSLVSDHCWDQMGVAVHYEYEDTSRGDGDMGCDLLPEEPTRIDAGLAKSALDIEPSDKTFTAGVKALANILQVTQHPDPCVLLEAVRIVIQTYLSSSAMEAANPDACDKLGAVKSSVKSLQFSVTAKECGFDLGDPVLSEADYYTRMTC